MITICVVIEGLLLIFVIVVLLFLSASNEKLTDDKKKLEEEIEKQKSFMAHQHEVLQQQAGQQAKEADTKIQQAKNYYQIAVKVADEAKLIRESNTSLEQRVNQLQSELYRARQKSKRQKSKNIGSE